MKIFVVEFEDRNFEYVYAKNKRQARTHMQAFANYRNTKIISVTEY